MKITPAHFLLGLALFWPAGAHADDALNCDEPQTTADMNQCADIAFDKADKELNALWPKLKEWAAQSDQESGENDGYYAKTLLASQRAWLAYRDAECVAAGLPMHGGTGEGPLMGGCRASLTEERVKDLRGLLPE
ncbi:lysozyme inhibitor LprI family protein [Aestuariivirga litoralis]|uniref:lysozyme inhibitor LprI family protein n=1 Tax=Aestuariivirga litoralis TaxID=2650924 RepID=UPI0018C7490A|nr:lysozyme inhibitor LprI family protein [Aestuariivirga litoralis]MBG1233074.1 DUF1311 domain-containing protein [Aestuariivirga litoralis]